MAESMVTPNEPRDAPVWLHRLAWLTAAATVVLLFVGGLVTSLGAGLAVPDWPTTFGYNMFLYPWSKMIGGVFYEHSHRLVASAVGLLTILLVVSLWLYERRRWLRWLGALALLLVALQGVIGGLRVVLLEQTLAILHACFAQAFFALAVSLAGLTSREWTEVRRLMPRSEAARLRNLCLFAAGMIYLQGVFGAVLRHAGAMLMSHVLVAGLIALQVFWIGACIFRLKVEQPELQHAAFTLGGLLILQLLLGLGSYLGKFLGLLSPLAVAWVTTSHVVTGALMLGVAVILALRCQRLSAPADTGRAPGLIAVAAAGASETTSL